MPPLRKRLGSPFSALIYSSLGAILLCLVLIGATALLQNVQCDGGGCAIIQSGAITYTVGAIVALILCYPVLYWILFSYELTERTITVNTGIIFRQYESIDFDRIQSINNERGPLLWLLGLTMVKIWTASADQMNFSVEKDSVRSEATPDTTLVLDEKIAHDLKEFVMSSRHKD